jgi:DNA-binding transcriptional regulator YiaG
MGNFERQVGVLKRHRTIAAAARAANGAQDTKVRFVAKGLKSQRNRLGLSAGDYARLVGVSAQSIYNWEQGNSTPRPPQLAIIATLRGMGKREVRQHLDAMGAKRATKGS